MTDRNELPSSPAGELPEDEPVIAAFNAWWDEWAPSFQSGRTPTWATVEANARILAWDAWLHQEKVHRAALSSQAARRESEDTRDAERMDWLEQNPHSGVRIEFHGRIGGYSVEAWDGALLGHGTTLRDAIDTARTIGTDGQEAKNHE